jgi:transcriptional regulator with XRE-family HTH domain
LGADLRARRVAQDLTLAGLASRIGCTVQHISDVELAKSTASESFVAAADAALGAGGRLLALHPAVVCEQVVERQKRADARRGALRSPQEADDVKRREFIGLGLAVVLLGPEAAKASREDWERIADAWSYEMSTAPDRNALLPGLTADLKRLHAAGGPQRVVAQLASYVASIAMSNGDTGLARRWWRRARASAVAGGDSHLVAYVAGRQAMQGLYGAYSPRHVVLLADEALGATKAPCTGRVSAVGAKAQALAMLGRQRPTSETLAALEYTFNRLPSEITRDKLSSHGWAEERLHHVRSYCGMYGAAAGEAAREDALRLYAQADWRGRAQIKLHRAAYEADPQDAVATLTDLSDTQRKDRFVHMIAARALAVCEARQVAGVADLRAAL